jgi:hypothetical protein
MRKVVAGGTLALMLLAASVACADRVDELMGKLRADADYKVRLSAALSLGKLADPRAIPALADGLADPDKSVRLVAAGALGKLVDASVPVGIRNRSIAALEAALRGEDEESVRAQAQRALEALRRLPPPPTPGVGRGVYIEIGGMADKTQRGGAVLGVMRQTVMTSIQRKAPAYQVRWAGGGGRAPTEDDLRRAGATAFYVDASLTRLDTQGSRVSCAVSMILATYPARSMFGFLNGSAEVDPGSASARAMAEAAGDCVSAVLDDLVSTKIVPTIQARVP